MSRSGSGQRLRSSYSKLSDRESPSSTMELKPRRRMALLNPSNSNIGSSSFSQSSNNNNNGSSSSTTTTRSQTGCNGNRSNTRGIEIDNTSQDATMSATSTNDSEKEDKASPSEDRHSENISSSRIVAGFTDNDKKDNTNNDSAMDVDEDSSSSSSSSDSSDSSDEDSSEIDEETSEKKIIEFKDDMEQLEKQFNYIREYLYKERIEHVQKKLEEVRSGKAKEYLEPLQELQENMRTRLEVAARLKEYRLENMKNKFEAEDIAAYQNFESDKSLLYDSLKEDLEEKIHRLEEDRNNDFTSELWLESALKRKNKKSIDIFGEKKKKPITITGPFIVYMLNDVDIVEDWTVLKKSLTAPKRKYVEMAF